LRVELEPKAHGGGRERTLKVHHLAYLRKRNYILEYPFTTQSHYGAALVDPLEFPTFLSINTSFVSKAIISGMGLPF